MLDQKTAPYAALLLRVSLGVMFLAHAILLKVMTFTVAGTVQYFESLGLPGVFAYLTIGGETLAGIALVLGVQTRLVSIAVLPILIGALVVHSGNGWVFSAKGGGWEFPLGLVIAAGVQALLGDGALALSRSLSVDQVRAVLAR